MHFQADYGSHPMAVFTGSAMPGPRPLSAFVVLALTHPRSVRTGCDSDRARIWSIPGRPTGLRGFRPGSGAPPLSAPAQCRSEGGGGLLRAVVSWRHLGFVVHCGRLLGWGRWVWPSWVWLPLQAGSVNRFLYLPRGRSGECCGYLCRDVDPLFHHVLDHLGQADEVTEPTERVALGSA